MKPLVLFQAPVLTRSGYGAHSRDILRSLMNTGKYDIKVGSLNWGDCPMNALDDDTPENREMKDLILKEPALDRQPDINIQVTVPNEFQNIGKYNICITAGIETTLCSVPWVEGVNRMDLVIVPSQHSKKVFDESVFTQKDQNGNVTAELKCTTPIEVLFEGADTEIYKKTNKIPETIKTSIDNLNTNWNFLYVGHWLKGELGQDRKDTGMLVKVFLETFKDMKNPPGLIMKTSGATFSVMDKFELKKKIKHIQLSVSAKSLPPIHIVHGDLTDDEINGLYNHRKVKAHISFTKGEGFGRPLLEASISQKPVIAPNWSGHIDFLNEQSVLLPGKLAQVHPSVVWENVILPESQWFTINYPYAAKAMKDVHKNYRNYIVRAQKQGLVSSGKFSLKKMDKVFDEMLDKYLPKFAQEMALKMPTMNLQSNVSGDNPLPKISLPKAKKLGETANV